MYVCARLHMETLGWRVISLREAAVQTDGARALLHIDMTQVSTGPAAGSDAAVLQDGVEAAGSAGVSDRKRLHGGEDEGQTVRHVLVGGTSQSRRVACREMSAESMIQDRKSSDMFTGTAYPPHPQP